MDHDSRVRSAGRPGAGSRVVDRTTIGIAALGILEREGASALTVARVAREVGTRSQSLYHHVRDVDDVIEAARGILVARVDQTAVTRGPGLSGIEEFAESYFRSFAPVAESVHLFFNTPVGDHSTILGYERFVEHLTNYGLEASTAVGVLLRIEYAVFFALYEGTTLKNVLNPPTALSSHAPTLARGLATYDLSESARILRLRAAVREMLAAFAR